MDEFVALRGDVDDDIAWATEALGMVIRVQSAKS